MHGNELTAQLLDGGTLEFSDKAKLYRTGNTITVAFYEPGVAISCEGTIVPTQIYIWGCHVKIPRSFFGRARGLLGNFDGDTTNEFFRREGTTLVQLSNDLSQSQRYPHLNTCK